MTGATVVVGAAGQLGTAFRTLLGDDCAPLSRAELDLADLDAIEPAIASLRPALVINCAAYNAVDRAEGEPDAAHAVNASAVERLALAARRAGAGFVTFSTDYVFDGAASKPYVESSPARPLSVYGRSKLEGERLALAVHPRALVVRTSWFLSGTHANFASKMIQLVRRGPVRVVADQVGRATLVDDLAPAVLAAVEARATGLLHLTNGGELSRFDLAREAVELAGLDPEAVSPTTTDEFAATAPRPRYSVLGSERALVAPLPHYRAGLERAVAALVASGVAA